MPDLSVIILSYNTKNTTRKCIESLHKSLNESNILSEIIIIENNSVDGSYEMVKKILENSNKKIIYKAIFNKINYGYAKGNNQGIKIAKSRNILFLNSDVIIQDIKWDKLLYYFVNNPNIGALTVKVNTLDGNIDQASHRGFPTVWNAFTYYSKLEKIFGKVPVLNIFFGGYHLTKLNLNKIHEIDSPSGAFYLTSKKVMNKLKGFDDKTFFLYGEDLDLSYRIKELGLKIVYFPKYKVLHLKSISGLKKRDIKIKSASKKHFYSAMKKFYKKHYENKYPKFIKNIVYYFIDLKSKSS